MNPKQLVDMMMALVNSQQLSEDQRYEIIGRFNTAMLSGQTPSTVASTPAKTEIDYTLNNPIVIPSGNSCKCTECKKVAYTVIKNVHDKMPPALFRECFKPPLPEDGELWGDQQGNIAIDCPNCKSEFTVWIKGEGSYSMTQDLPDNFLSRE